MTIQDFTPAMWLAVAFVAGLLIGRRSYRSPSQPEKV